MKLDLESLLSVSTWIIMLIPIIISIIWWLFKRITFKRNSLKLSLIRGSYARQKSNDKINVEVSVFGEKIKGTIFDLRIELANNGINDIEGSWFKEKYRIIFPEKTMVLNADLYDAPEEDRPVITSKDNYIEIEWGKMLKRKKSYKFDVIVSTEDKKVSQYSPEILFNNLTDKIYAKDINKVNKNRKHSSTLFVGLLYLVAVILISSTMVYDYYQGTTSVNMDFISNSSNTLSGYVSYNLHNKSIIVENNGKDSVLNIEHFNANSYNVTVHPQKQVSNFNRKSLFEKISFIFMLTTFAVCSILCFWLDYKHIKKR